MATTTGTTIEEPTTDLGESTAPHPLAEAGQDAVDSAGHLASRAADLGIRQADRGREMAASGLQNVADSIRRVSLDMEADQPQIATIADTAAEQADRVATYLRTTDARQVIGNVEDVARRQPFLFLGGAFLLGLAASRFLKAASVDDGAQARTGMGYGTGYGGGYASAGVGAFEPTGPGNRTNAEGL